MTTPQETPLTDAELYGVAADVLNRRCEELERSLARVEADLREAVGLLRESMAAFDVAANMAGASRWDAAKRIDALLSRLREGKP